MSPVDLAAKLRRLAVADDADPDDLRKGLMLGADALDGQPCTNLREVAALLDSLRQILTTAEGIERYARNALEDDSLTAQVRLLVSKVDGAILDVERGVAP